MNRNEGGGGSFDTASTQHSRFPTPVARIDSTVACCPTFLVLDGYFSQLPSGILIYQHGSWAIFDEIEVAVLHRYLSFFAVCVP